MTPNCLQAVFPDDVVVDRTRIERTVELARAVVRVTWRNIGSAAFGAMARERQIFLDKPLRHRMDGDEPDLAALAPDENAPRPDGLAPGQVRWMRALMDVVFL
jgi:hypothetical protein